MFMNLKYGYLESQLFSNNQWRIIENMLDHLEDKRQSQLAFGLALGVVFLGLVYSEILVCLVSFYLLTFLKKTVNLQPQTRSSPAESCHMLPNKSLEQAGSPYTLFTFPF